MSRIIDITGNRYGNLVVVKRAESSKRGVAMWECMCDCGNKTVVSGSNLRNGLVKSCGCLRKIPKTTTHNMSHTKLYRKWAAIKRRCTNPHDKSYKDYGMRNIKMCDEWKNSFEAFMKWALANGYSDALTIERKDVNGDYCPENCTWIPWNEQQGNRRFCRYFEYNGKIKNLAEWCRDLDKPYKTIYNRIFKLGWSFEKAISEEVHAEKRNNLNGRIRI